MIGPLLYLSARLRRRDVFDEYLVRAGDFGAWRGAVLGAERLPWWLRPATGALHEANVRVLVGRPARTLALLDEVEAAAGVPLRIAWPSLRGFIHVGEAFEPYEDLYRRRIGEGVAMVPGEPDPECTLNAFGERLDRAALVAAVTAAQEACGRRFLRWEVEPEYPSMAERRGRHLWRVEFEAVPDDLRDVGRALDRSLGEIDTYAEVRPFLRDPLLRLAV
ncbi:MAG: hypothetical protein ACYTGN_02915 [Planctomycetota bacterium]|jgi:hypothetical protein